MTTDEPVAVDDHGIYLTEWYCTPPEKAQQFRVLRDEWVHDDGGMVRRIYEWSA